MQHCCILKYLVNNLTITLFSSCQEIFQPCRLRQLCNTLGRNPVWKKSVSGYWILYFPHSFNITINQNSSASFNQNVCWSWLQLSSVRDYKGRALIKKKNKNPRLLRKFFINFHVREPGHYAVKKKKVFMRHWVQQDY